MDSFFESGAFYGKLFHIPVIVLILTNFFGIIKCDGSEGFQKIDNQGVQEDLETVFRIRYPTERYTCLNVQCVGVAGMSGVITYTCIRQKGLL